MLRRLSGVAAPDGRCYDFAKMANSIAHVGNVGSSGARPLPAPEDVARYQDGLRLAASHSRLTVQAKDSSARSGHDRGGGPEAA